MATLVSFCQLQCMVSNSEVIKPHDATQHNTSSLKQKCFHFTWSGSSNRKVTKKTSPFYVVFFLQPLQRRLNKH